MIRRILFVTGLTLMALAAGRQDSDAKTWKNTKVSADSILATMDRGDSIIMDSCEIFGPLKKEGTRQRPDTITSSIEISRSTFRDTVLFSWCCFTKTVRFDGTVFDNCAVFSGATFNRTTEYATSFFGATIRGTADFSGATFAAGVLFWNTTFEGHVDFWGTSFATAVFLGAIFRTSVEFSPVKFEGIAIQWQQLEGHLSSSGFYTYKLMKWFQDQRHLDEADRVYLFLKDQERIRKPPWIRYPEYWLMQLTCGYGAKPERVLLLSIFVILLFCLFYADRRAIQQTEQKLGHLRRRGRLRRVRSTLNQRLYDALYFSLQTFILGVVPGWHPSDEYLISTRKIRLLRFRTLTMIEGALGWILLVLFVVTLTRKFIR